jgi:hypothetical protein
MSLEKSGENLEPKEGSSNSKSTMPPWLKPNKDKDKDMKYYADKHGGKTEQSGKHVDFEALAEARERHKDAFQGKLCLISSKDKNALITCTENAKKLLQKATYTYNTLMQVGGDTNRFDKELSSKKTIEEYRQASKIVHQDNILIDHQSKRKVTSGNTSTIMDDANNNYRKFEVVHERLLLLYTEVLKIQEKRGNICK